MPEDKCPSYKNKFKYQNKKKQKENIKKQREANLEMKEYRLSVAIDIHDYDTTLKNGIWGRSPGMYTKRKMAQSAKQRKEIEKSEDERNKNLKTEFDQDVNDKIKYALIKGDGTILGKKKSINDFF